MLLSTAEAEKNIIRYAFYAIELYTCIRFYEGHNKYYHYIYITNFFGSCQADIGYHHKPHQLLNLASADCINHGTVIHEVVHALGFYHQHVTYDRDLYVYIDYNNVRRGFESNFWNRSETEVTNLGYGYDYESIMHYMPYDYSVNGKPTITSRLWAVHNIGRRNTLTSTDIAKINKLYKCFYYRYN